MKYDVVIIGAGPAGYVAAIRAGQAGLKTLVIEKRYTGGMCLNWGCIPTKALLESAKFYHRIKSAASFGIAGIRTEELSFDWEQARLRAMSIRDRLVRGIEYLWKKHAVEIIIGEAIIHSAHEVEVNRQIITTEHVIIATGSKPERLSIDTKVPVFELEGMMQMHSVPSRPLVYGNGPVAWEIFNFFSLTDSQPVWLIPRLPVLPGLDDYANDFVLKKTRKEKQNVIYDKKWTLKGKTVSVGDSKYEIDGIVNCSLRQAVLPHMDKTPVLEEGFIKVDEDFRTSIADIYAIGDVNGISNLAHVASAQGLYVINRILGVQPEHLTGIYPINIYSEPEIAQVGKTEQQLKKSGIDYQVSEYNLQANGKALIEGNAEGVLRVLSETKYKQVLGVLIIAPDATDMIAEATAVMELEGTAYEIAHIIHAHPTVSEVFMEAGLVAIDQPLHK
jgi:dihydrolipoamide dehydrogenase